MPTLTPAERARLAHQILRLKENGISDLRAIAPLVAATDLSYVAPEGAPQTLGGSGHPLERIAVRVAQHADSEMPGPTDSENYIEHLFTLSLRGIYEEWKSSSSENLRANHPDDYAHAREAWQRSEQRRREADALMSARGEWPSREHGLRHGAGDWAMANALYDLGREGFLAGDIDWDGNTIKAVLLDSADYTVNLATHDNLDDIPSAARVATSGALASKTVTAGVADAADLTLTAVTGDPSEAIALYKDTGTESTSRLIGYIDTATGLPVTPNGGDITVAWDNGSNRIFKL